MKKLSFLLFVLVALITSCIEKRDETAFNQTAQKKRDSLVPSVVTIIENLPDSLQPRVVNLADAPPPNKIRIPTSNRDGRTYYASSGRKEMEPPVSNFLPTLKSNEGQTVVDKNGNPYILGNGGISHFTNYTMDDGMPSGEVFASFFDESGFLWIGTRAGVSRFDGLAFTTYTTAHGLAQNDVRCIIQDQKGNLWFGGEGISRFDGHTFTNFTKAQGLAADGVSALAVDRKGIVWFGSGEGLSSFDGSSFKNYPNISSINKWESGRIERSITSIVEDQEGELWLGTNGGGVIRFNPKNNTSKTYSNEEGFTNPWIRGMTVDQKGHVWIGTFGGGVMRYDPEKDGFTNYKIDDGLAGNVVQSVSEDHNGTIWFGTNGAGLSRYDRDIDGFKTFTTQQGLAGNRVWSISGERTGHIWIATRDGGLSRYNGEAFTKFSTEQGLGNNIIRSIGEDQKGQLWFGTEGFGVSRFDGESFTTFTGAQGLGVGGNGILSVSEDRTGNMWFGTLCCGVFKYDGSFFTQYDLRQGLAQQSVVSILEDISGDFWFGIWGAGMSHFDGESFTTFTHEQGLAGNVIISIIQDKVGGIWFGTPGLGVSRFDGKSFTNFNNKQGLVNNEVQSITKDNDGNLWFATNGGISLMKGSTVMELWGQGKEFVPLESTQINYFQSFTKNNGLPSNSVQKVLQLSNGKMAAGTDKGIVLFNAPQNTENNIYTLKGVEIYNVQNGYPVKDVFRMYKDSKDIIWIASANNESALTRFDYNALAKNTSIPEVYIRELKLNNERLSWKTFEKNFRTTSKNNTLDSLKSKLYLSEEVSVYGKILTDSERSASRQKYKGIKFDGVSPYYSIPQKLVLPFEHNNLTIDYGTKELANPSLVEYQYKLEGYNKDWSPILKQTSATFGNIGEGKYVFKVKARYTGPGVSGANEWSSPLAYSFRVSSPWYRTWWAYFLYFLIIGSGLYLFIKWRTSALEKRAKELERTVAERTAEVVSQKEIILQEKNRSEKLLLNILPAEIAEELKKDGSSPARNYEMATVLFTDFKQFTVISEQLSAQDLVAELNVYFKAFDDIIIKYKIEKIKTIGDAYMAAGGLHQSQKTEAKDVVLAALEMQEFMLQKKRSAQELDQPFFRMRCGIHTGPVIAGIVGVIKFQYDIWGDTVNLASRMESNGEEGRVNISKNTYDLIKNDPDFKFIYRGKIEVKHKGEVDMYFVEKRE